jgi:hypothetical protein
MNPIRDTFLLIDIRNYFWIFINILLDGKIYILDKNTREKALDWSKVI